MSNKRTWFMKLISVSMILAILMSVASIGTYAETTTRDFQAELDAIQAKIDAANKDGANSLKTVEQNNEENAEIQKQLDIINEQIDYKQGQIDVIQAEIDGIQAEIDATDREINETNAKIETLNKTIADTYEVLKGRLRASYMAGETSTLEILLGSSDYESFLTRLELLSVVTKKDDALVSGLQKDIEDLNASVESLNTKRAQQEERNVEAENKKSQKQTEMDSLTAARATQQSKQDRIEANNQKINAHLASLDESTAEWRAEKAKIEKDQAEYDAKMSGGMSNGSGNISSGGGTSNIGNYPVSSKGMINPLQYSNAYISQHYGHNGHKGVDICTRGTGSTMGKEIRAAADGTVYSAEYHYSWGNNVYVDHGNGVYTRYAHCSSMIVSKGQSVKQGQVIGYVGSTGQSTGPHLHFEVWVNGTRVNPESWIPSLPD